MKTRLLLAAAAAASFAAFATDMDHKGRVIATVETRGSGKCARVKMGKNYQLVPGSKVDFFVEYGGVQVAAKEVVKNIKSTIGKDAKEIAVYLKPEESKAYFVADGESGSMDVYFC